MFSKFIDPPVIWKSATNFLNSQLFTALCMMERNMKVLVGRKKRLSGKKEKEKKVLRDAQIKLGRRDM